MSLSIVRPDATRPNRPPAAKLSTPSSEYFGDDLDLSNWPTKNKSRGNRPVDVGQPLAGDKRRYRTEWPSIKLLCWRGSAVSPISGRWRLSRIRKRSWTRRGCMLRPAWLCHQRRAVGFSDAQFQPDFISMLARIILAFNLLVGVAPAIPTTPSDLDADCVAIFNRVMIGGLHADWRGVRRYGAAWTNTLWRGPLRPTPTVPIRFGWCYTDVPPPRPQGPSPPRWRRERRPDGRHSSGRRPLDGSCSRGRGKGGGHRDHATTIEDGARLHAEGEWTRKNRDVKWMRWRRMLGNDGTWDDASPTSTALLTPIPSPQCITTAGEAEVYSTSSRLSTPSR